MERRSMLALLACGLLGGCGGGGGAASVAAQGGLQEAEPDVMVPPAGPDPAAAQSLSPNIALWGDSMTGLYFPSMQQTFSDRQIYDGGVSGETSMQIAARQTADTEHKAWISVFWYGHNNWTKDPVKADIAASVAALAPGNGAFIVMSMVNWAGTGERGTQEYANIMRVNSELAAAYPDNYLDIHRYLVGLYNPNSWQDAQDFQNDLPPSSLRFDEIHLNPAGCDAVAEKIKAFITAKGW